jgi:tRNA(fMet)-specific endonuclease VapC
LVVLDTSVLVHLVRNDGVGQRVLSDHGLHELPDRPLVSIVTVGEMQALAELWNWGQRKKNSLDDLLRQVVVVRLSQGDIVRRYGEIEVFNKRTSVPARPVGENDTWIAATANAVDGTLVTADSDFDHLGGKFFSLVRVDSNTGETVVRTDMPGGGAS